MYIWEKGRAAGRVGSGRVRLFVGNRGSGRVNVLPGRVGSGRVQEKWPVDNSESDAMYNEYTASCNRLTHRRESEVIWNLDIQTYRQMHTCRQE